MLKWTFFFSFITELVMISNAYNFPTEWKSIRFAKSNQNLLFKLSMFWLCIVLSMFWGLCTKSLLNSQLKQDNLDSFPVLVISHTVESQFRFLNYFTVTMIEFKLKLSIYHIHRIHRLMKFYYFRFILLKHFRKHSICYCGNDASVTCVGR